MKFVENIGVTVGFSMKYLRRVNKMEIFTLEKRKILASSSPIFDRVCYNVGKAPERV